MKETKRVFALRAERILDSHSIIVAGLPTRCRTDLDAMLAAAFAGDGRLTPADLAPLDQFHSRGILATAELAKRAGIERATRVLDVGPGGGVMRRSYRFVLGRADRDGGR